ncbi:glycoside hydrolase family 2 TIM barrel-domain containing protein [Metabacillus indicus]|uniref:glycoside hydrolase family 2 TIM barrel-domain containing protein n=1 Tax=Metabacillus indicus TaxID=246786 RepID=UPI000A788A55|nr:glycoside hydrolase family 2 TIM barrel-domain containing protein [Metabacillus indicus]
MTSNTYEVIGSLKATMQLKTIDGRAVPFQNDIPYPSFEPQQRKILNLAGEWKKQRFEADHDLSMSERNDEWIRQTEREGYHSLTFDDSSWDSRSLPLPENRLTGKEEVNAAETYENGVWYRRTFLLDDTWSEKVITLKCLGVSYVGDFWINGTYAGCHEGGYTPFAFDATNLVTTGENTIAVRIDNPPWTMRIDTVPAVNNDFFNYTGIIHDLYLEAASAVQVVRADVVPKNTEGELEVSVVLENRTDSEQNLFLTGLVHETDMLSPVFLTEPDAKSICAGTAEFSGMEERSVFLAAGETKVISCQVKIAAPKLWSIREPNLYVIEVQVSNSEEQLDAFYSQFGIRTLAKEKAQIKLNGKSVFFAGVARHEEWPEYGRTASWERIKSDFLQIADLSVNMVRTAHYPNHIYTFIMLDRLGLTAMSEIPLWQFETHHYEAQEQRGISYQMWREMIYSNYNRPSIIMWSTQNESKDVLLRKAYNERLAAELRSSYNDGRLTTQSAAADQPGYDDASMEPLDVAGWTMYFGIFHGSTPYEGTRDFIEKAHARWPDKPIINTEYGIWSNADKSFIEKQVEIYEDVQLALIEKATVSPQGIANENGYVAAIDYWTVFDWYVNHNEFYQTMGMYHMDRKTTKPLYDHFIEDHRRLMGETNGIGEFSYKQYLSKLKGTIEKDTGEFFIEEVMDLSEDNYLIVSVLDSVSEDGMSVSITNASGISDSYQTYGIKTKEAFPVHVPLWKLKKDVLKTASKIKITHTGGRKLEIIEMMSGMFGK